MLQCKINWDNGFLSKKLKPFQTESDYFVVGLFIFLVKKVLYSVFNETLTVITTKKAKYR